MANFEEAAVKPNPYIDPTPWASFSIREIMRFMSNKERKEMTFNRMLGNFRLRKRGHKISRIIDWRK